MKNKSKLSGFAVVIAAIVLCFAACSDGSGGIPPYIPPPYIPPEEWPVKDRWWKWVDEDTSATLTYSVDDDGVCKITVGGFAEPDWDIWKALAGYSYTAKAGVRYDYTFEAWTESGNRTFDLNYYEDNDEYVFLGKSVSITNEQTTYTIKGQALPKGGHRAMIFHCANQTGTFYVKLISITEVSGNNISDFVYSEEDSKIIITGYDGPGGVVTIPTQINGKQVTDIGDKAFYHCNSLTSVTIPESVTSIGNEAFKSCNSLTGITIPNSVTSIGNDAFMYCNSLTSVSIPNSIKSIGDDAFRSCASLTAINVDSGNTNYSSDQGVLYDKSKTILIQYPLKKTGNTFTIPNSVTSIGNEAFQSCSSLASITIPNSVKSIGNFAFSVTGITGITIPNSVTSIGNDAFMYCYSLTSVTFQGTIISENFSSDKYDFGSIGDLRTKYLAGGTGTYTRASGSLTWVKQ